MKKKCHSAMNRVLNFVGLQATKYRRRVRDVLYRSEIGMNRAFQCNSRSPKVPKEEYLHASPARTPAAVDG